jgi:hypothetical protein
MRRQQERVGALLPELQEAEAGQEGLVTALEQVAREGSGYSQRLAGVREQYSGKLSQIAGFLGGGKM